MTVRTPSAPTAAVSTVAWLLLLTLVLIWGTSFILIKKALLVYTPMQVGTLRVFAAMCVLLPFAWGQWRRLPRRLWPYLVSVGLLGSLFPAVFFAVAGKHIDSSLSGALNAVTPLATLLIGIAFFNRPMVKGKLWGLLLGLGGTLVLVLLRSGGQLDFNAYAILPLLAATGYGLNLNVIKTHLQTVSPTVLTALSLLTVGPWAGIYLFSTDFTTRLAQADNALPALSYVLILGVLGTAIALVLLNRLLQIAEPVFASSTTYLIPLVALLWGVGDGEPLLPAHLLGLGAILLGVFLVNRHRA